MKDRRTLIILDVPQDGVSVSEIAKTIATALEVTSENSKVGADDEIAVNMFSGKDLTTLLKANRQTIAVRLVKNLMLTIGDPSKLGNEAWKSKFWYLFYTDKTFITREVLSDIKSATDADKKFFAKANISFIVELATTALTMTGF